MMPVQTEGVEDHKAKYKTLKRKLKLLIYENECFQEELRKSQRALLRVRRDKSFLLDRLLQYHRGPDSSSDSEQTEDSDAEVESKSCRKRLSMDGGGGGSGGGGGGGNISGSPGQLAKPPPAKKKKSSSSGGSKSSGKHAKQVRIPVAVTNIGNNATPTTVTVAGAATTVRKLTAAQLASAGLIQGQTRRIGHIGAGGVVVASGGAGGGDGQLSREEVERRLAARQPMNDYTTTTVSLTLPKELFSDIMEGDFKEEDMETSPSNIDDEITVDNYD